MIPPQFEYYKNTVEMKEEQDSPLNEEELLVKWILNKHDALCKLKDVTPHYSQELNAIIDERNVQKLRNEKNRLETLIINKLPDTVKNLDDVKCSLEKKLEELHQQVDKYLEVLKELLSNYLTKKQEQIVKTGDFQEPMDIDKDNNHQEPMDTEEPVDTEEPTDTGEPIQTLQNDTKERNEQIKPFGQDIQKEKRTLESELSAIKRLYEQNTELGEYLINKYKWLIKLEDLNEESPDINKYEKSIKEIQDITTGKFHLSGKCNINELLALYVDKFKVLYDMFNESIKIFSKEKDKFESYVKYQKFQKNIHSLEEEKRRLISDLIPIYNGIPDSDEYTEWVQFLEKIDQDPYKFQVPNQNNIANLIEECRKHVEDLNKDIQDFRAEKDDIERRIQKLSDERICALKEINESLKNEAAKNSSALGKATNFDFGDHDSNNISQLVKDIRDLKYRLEKFFSLRNANLNEKEIKGFLKKYSYTVEINKNRNLIEGVLQSHIVQRIINEAEEYLKKEGKEGTEFLESNITSMTTKLQEHAKLLSEFRVGTDKVTDAIPVKLRQLMYTILGNRGFSRVKNGKSEDEHPFIVKLRKDIIELMNRFREIKDPERKNEIEAMATEVIQQIIVIFCIRFKVQEPMVEFVWFKKKDKINLEFMEGPFDGHKNAEVYFCSFPLIVTNYEKENCKMILKATVEVPHTL